MKKTLCLILILAVLAGLSCPATAADIWFIAVDDSIPLTLTGDYMPFYYNSKLYVPFSAFTTGTLNVFSDDSTHNILVLYNADVRLTFDLNAGTVIMSDGTTESAVALSRGGTVFVPAYYVAGQFGLGCSLLEGSGGYPIVRLTSGSEIYDNDKLVAQSANLVQYRASQYYSELSPSPSPSPEITQPAVTPSPRVTPSPEVTESQPPQSEPVTVPDTALFFPGESFGDIAPYLDGASAVFTYDIDGLKGSDETVRAIICAGYDIAMELDLHDTHQAMEEMASFNDLLDTMTKTKTMLVIPKSNRRVSDEAVAALNDVGCRVWTEVVVAAGGFNVAEYENYVSVYTKNPAASNVAGFVAYVRYYGSDIIKVRLTTEPF